MPKPILEFERGAHYNPFVQWKDFEKDLMDILLKKNNTLWWESPDYKPGERIDIQTIFGWFDTSFATDLSRVKVYPFKKEGVRFDFELQTIDPRFPFKNQLRIIKACKQGFHRDWDRNGICIKGAINQEKERDWDLFNKDEEMRRYQDQVTPKEEL
jgi:hypothetical protein